MMMSSIQLAAQQVFTAVFTCFYTKYTVIVYRGRIKIGNGELDCHYVPQIYEDCELNYLAVVNHVKGKLVIQRANSNAKAYTTLTPYLEIFLWYMDLVLDIRQE